MLQDRFVHVRRPENQLQHFYRCFAQINRKSSDESCDCALLSSNFQCPFTRIIDNRAMNFFSLSHFFFFSHWIEHISPFLNIFETCIGNFIKVECLWCESSFFLHLSIHKRSMVLFDNWKILLVSLTLAHYLSIYPSGSLFVNILNSTYSQRRRSELLYTKRLCIFKICNYWAGSYNAFLVWIDKIYSKSLLFGALGAWFCFSKSKTCHKNFNSTHISPCISKIFIETSDCWLNLLFTLKWKPRLEQLMEVNGGWILTENRFADGLANKQLM